jgi:hypothetical protein
MEKKNPRHYDRRVLDRYVEKGLIKEGEYQDHLKNLPDESSNAQWVQMDLHDAEISEEDAGNSEDLDSEEVN